MSRIKPFWRIVLGFLLLCFCVYNTNMISMGDGNAFAFSFWWAALAAYIFAAIKIKYDDPLRSMRDLLAEETARKQQEQAAAAQKAETERQARQAAEKRRRDEWENTHGRIVTSIAGVTFNNDDGVSRQALLKDLKARGGDADLELEEYEYKGKPAIRVLVDGEQVGTIPRTRVAEVSEVLDRLESASLEVETFRPEEEEDEDGNVTQRGNLIYRADLYLIYTK